MLKKIFFLIFIILLFLSFVFIGAVIIYSQKRNISIQEELRTDSKNIISEIKNIIYSGATEHNPKGDVLPDRIDDTLINKLKEIF